MSSFKNISDIDDFWMIFHRSGNLVGNKYGIALFTDLQAAKKFAVGFFGSENCQEWIVPVNKLEILHFMQDDKYDLVVDPVYSDKVVSGQIIKASDLACSLQLSCN